MINVARRTDVHWIAATVLIVDLATAIGAPIWDYYFLRSDVPLQVGAATIAVVTFLGTWMAERNVAGSGPEANTMRDAIAATFVVTYLVIVGWATFLGFYSGNGQETLNPLANTVLPSFTVLTGVVVGGYFGADAIKQVTHIRAAQGRSQNVSASDRASTDTAADESD
jgi:protein-S-isoprenylcysteine O-methyltransferase Ste14